MDIFSLLLPKYTIDKNKKVRLITLFSGYDSQKLAFNYIGVDVEHYRAIEFDKYAMQSLNEIHNTNFETKDITKVSADELGIVDTENITYLLTYSFPCFTGDSMVLTSNGYKRIDEIQIEDYVLTHKNKYQKVLNFYNNGIKSIYQIKGMAIDEIKTTKNHKFLVRTRYRKWDNTKRTYLRLFEQPKWKEVEDISKNDYLGIAINQNSIIPIWNGINFEWQDGRKPRHKNELNKYMDNKNFWWIVGRYIGDGWLRNQGGIIICCDKNETNEIERKLQNLFNYSISQERTVNKIHIPLKELGYFCEQFGKGAKNKRLTNTIIDLPIDLLESFIDGYESADGCICKEKHRISSISRELIYGIGQCIAKVYKTPYKIYSYNRGSRCYIEGRECKINKVYEIVYKKEKRKQDKAFYENGYIWYPISSIEYIGEENVYDIEIENDHSFTVQNTIVHNCTDLSIAGKRAGMDRESGTRSGLLWEVERLLKETKEKPQILIMENVPQVLSAKGWREWNVFLENLGYSNYTQILNAKDYGIPQNRERCFMVSILGEYSYEFPKPFKLKDRLKDFLENDVDEKYYLSEKMKSYIFSKNDKYKVNDNNVQINRGVACAVTTREGSSRADTSNYIGIVDSYNKYMPKDQNVCGVIPAGYSRNQGTMVMETNMKTTLCNSLIENGVVKENYVINHSYTNGLTGKNPNSRQTSIINKNGIVPTVRENHGQVTTVVVKDKKGNQLPLYKDTKQLRETIEQNEFEEGKALDMDLYNRSTNKISQTLDTGHNKQRLFDGLRIRKLTPCECFKLMGVKPSDYNKITCSNAQKYKQAGNSIVTTVLMAIYSQLFEKCDYKYYIEELLKELRTNRNNIESE